MDKKAFSKNFAPMINRDYLQKILRTLGVFFQGSGLILGIVGNETVGNTLILFGFVMGILLLTTSRSLKNAGLNLIYSFGTIPIIMTTIFISVYFMSIITPDANSNVLRNGITLFILVLSTAGLFALAFYPYIAGAFGLSFAYNKLKKPKSRK